MTWTVERHTGGVLRIAFAGCGGEGSDGNSDGECMRGAIRESLAASGPVGLIIDLRGFDYCFGNWIERVPLVGLRSSGPGRVCVLAAGRTRESLRIPWEFTKLDRVAPIFEDLEDALRYLTRPGALPHGGP